MRNHTKPSTSVRVCGLWVVKKCEWHHLVATLLNDASSQPLQRPPVARRRGAGKYFVQHVQILWHDFYHVFTCNLIHTHTWGRTAFKNVPSFLACLKTRYPPCRSSLKTTSVLFGDIHDFGMCQTQTTTSIHFNCFICSLFLLFSSTKMYHEDSKGPKINP